MKFERITIDPARMNGQPCLRDLRMTVQRVVEIVALYNDPNKLLGEFPELDGQDIRQALAFAAAHSDDRLKVWNGHE